MSLMGQASGRMNDWMLGIPFHVARSITDVTQRPAGLLPPEIERERWDCRGWGGLTGQGW